MSPYSARATSVSLWCFSVLPIAFSIKTSCWIFRDSHNDEVYNRAVDNQIMRLRRKIRIRSIEPLSQYLRIERGHGFIFSVSVGTPY